MGNIAKKAFPVLNMHYVGCANNVEKTARKLPGVVDVSVNFASNTLTISYEDDKLAPEEIHAAVLAAGYDLTVEEANKEGRQEEEQHKRYPRPKRKVIDTWILMAPLFVFLMLLMHMSYSNGIQMLLAILIIVLFGGGFFMGTQKQAKIGCGSVDMLAALSTSIAFLLGLFNTFFPQFWTDRGLRPHVHYEASAAVITFVLTGKMMEERTKGNTSDAICKLMGTQPKAACVLRDGAEEGMQIDLLQAGDMVIVRPGGQVPVDGQLSKGNSYVDEGMTSGGLIPVEKKKGNKVFVGTVGQRGSSITYASQAGSDTMLACIIHMVQEVQGSRAPVQHIVDRITDILVLIMLGITILTFVLWVAIGDGKYTSYGIPFAVPIPVIACPCTLELTTPTALMVGIGKAAGQHILIRDAVTLEQMRKVDVVALDKTDTLTERHPTATGWSWAQSQEEHFKDILLVTELKPEHPLASAIVVVLQDGEKVAPAPLSSFESITGKGIRVFCQDKTYWVGSHKLLKDFSATVGDVMTDMLVYYESNGNRIIYFGRENELLAIVVVSNPVKATSAGTAKELKRQGINICMFAGDGQWAALTVSSRLDIERSVADALPNDKVELMRELQMQGKKVTVVGDGVNDPQAFASADVSIVMEKDTGIAMDVAMATLMTFDLLLLPKAFELSRQTVQLIHQNLFRALIYNLIGIPIAAGVLFPTNGSLLNPMLAGTAMAFFGVSVVFNLSSLGRRKT